MTLGLLLAIALQGVVRAPSLLPAPTPGQVLAKVDGRAITTEDVAPLLWEARGSEILNDVIAYGIIKAEADRLGIVVTDQQVNAAAERQLKEYGATLPDGSDPAAELANQGLTRSRFFLNVKTDALLTGIANGRIKPEAWVKVSTILIAPAPGSGPAGAAAARAKVQKAADRLKAGESWAKVSEETIEDPNGKKTGGLLGWRAIELFPAALRPEIEKAAAGAVTVVGETPYGFQLFRIELPGREAKGVELEDLRKTALVATRDRVLTELRGKAKIERLYGAKPNP